MQSDYLIYHLGYLRLHKPDCFVPLETEREHYLIIDRKYRSYQSSIEWLDMPSVLGGLAPGHRQLIDLIYSKGFTCTQVAGNPEYPLWNAQKKHYLAFKALQP